MFDGIPGAPPPIAPRVAVLLVLLTGVRLIVAAFARPFFPQGAAAALAAAGGSREIVILLDQSASMGYGDHWQRARDAARSAINSLGAGDRAEPARRAHSARLSRRPISRWALPDANGVGEAPSSTPKL